MNRRPYVGVQTSLKFLSTALVSFKDANRACGPCRSFAATGLYSGEVPFNIPQPFSFAAQCLFEVTNSPSCAFVISKCLRCSHSTALGF